LTDTSAVAACARHSSGFLNATLYCWNGENIELFLSAILIPDETGMTMKFIRSL